MNTSTAIVKYVDPKQQEIRLMAAYSLRDRAFRETNSRIRQLLILSAERLEKEYSQERSKQLLNVTL